MSDSIKLTELNHKDAKKFLLESKSYSNIDLPEYFSFEEILSELSREMRETHIEEYFEKGESPQNTEYVNHCLIANKDGELSWRPYEVINPILYVGLVHYITKKKIGI